MNRFQRLLFSLPLLLLILGVTSQAFARDEFEEQPEQDKKEGMRFSIGANAYYAMWQPIWRLENMPPRNMFIGIFSPPDTITEKNPAFFYGPVLGLRFSNNWSTSMSFFYGKTNTKMMNTYFGTGMSSGQNGFYPYNKKASKYELEWTFSYNISKYVKYYFGPKFQGYTYQGMQFLTSSSIKIPFTTDISQLSGGLGTGFGFAIPLFWNIYLMPNVAILGLVAKEKRESSATNSLGYAGGASGSLGLAYYIEPLNTTINVSGKAQYLYYFKKPYDAYIKSDDLFYGLNFSLVFTF